jgi:hypothetical protein
MSVSISHRATPYQQSETQEEFDITRYGAIAGGSDTVNNAALAVALAAAKISATQTRPVYIPDADFPISAAFTDEPIWLTGPGRLVHQQAKSVMTVTRTFGSAVSVSSISTVTLGMTSGGSPDAIKCTRLNVPSVAGFGIGTIVHLVSQDVYAFSAQQSPGQNTYMAEMIRLTGVAIEYSGETGGGFAEKDTITGATSGATARVVAVTDDGTTGKLLLTDISGAFQDGEALKVGGTTRGTANGAMFLACAGTLRYPLATSVQVRAVPEIQFILDGPELVCSGDPDSIVGSANRLPAFILIGVTNPQVKQRIRSAWTRAWQLWSCWQGDFDLLIDSLPNNADLTEQAYGYGIDWSGASFGIRARINGGNCRHAFTTNTTWASSFGSVDYRKWGAFKGGLVYDSFVSGAKAAAFDTHAGGFGLTFDNCKAASGTAGGRYLTTADGFHNRSFGTTYRNCQADTVRPFYDESTIYASNDIAGGHKITYENSFGRYGYIGFEVAAIPAGVNYTGVQDYVSCSAQGDGSATNTPYYQYGFHTGNGVEANYVACRSASFNGAPWGFEGFGKATLLGGCLADYTNAPAFASPLRVNGDTQIINVDGYNVRYQTSTSTPAQLLRAASTAVNATFNIGDIQCLNNTTPTLLLDAGSGTKYHFRGQSGAAKSGASEPTVTMDIDHGYNVGDAYINTTRRVGYTCIDNTAGAAVWVRSTGRRGLKLQTNRWYGPVCSQSTVTAISNREYALPFEVTESKAPQALGMRVNTAGTSGGNVRMGIRADNGGVPGTLVVDAGTVTIDTTGDRTVTIFNPPTLAPGMYWLTYVFESVATMPVMFSNNSGSLNELMQALIGQTNMGGLIGQGSPTTGIYGSFSFAALASSFANGATVTYNDGANTPYIGIQF